MTRAASLGRAVRRSASPNPGVGCVLETRDGRVFEGATRPPGQAHAEVVALDAARADGAETAGATMWVTLEPCSHAGRTGPCAEALVEARVARVVVGIQDPDPRVSGRGCARLREAGIDVVVGELAGVIAHDLRAFVTHRSHVRPFVTLKLAATLDGRTAAPDRTSKWITGPEARADVHRLRAEHDAVLVGSGTVRTDNPALTVRDADGPDPIRVVLGTAPVNAAVRPCLERAGELVEILRGLAGDGVTSLLVEGGARVANAFHIAGLVDEYVLYLAPALLGGDDGASLFVGPGAPTISDAWRGEILDVVRLGADLRVTLAPKARN